MEITLEKLTKSFDGVDAIVDFELSVGDGEMMALLGPSGCGKTTTLLAISGIHKVTKGTIRFGGRDVTALPPQERNVGVVFQSYALYPHLSVFENIAFPLRVRKERGPGLEAMVREMAGILRIEELLERRPAALSGGQQQRVALARALVRKPDVLLMDEPLANLDAGLRLEMRTEIRRIQHETGSTAILVTHDQVEAMSMCDRIALMNAGRLEQVGPPEDMYHRPRTAFVAGFIGNPPISFYEGNIRDGRFVAEGLSFELPEGLKAAVRSGQVVTLGLRPEGLQPDLPVPVEGRVSFVESQSRETLYDLTLADGSVLRSVQAGGRAYRVGESVRWGLDPASAHLFDAEGRSVRAG